MAVCDDFNITRYPSEKANYTRRTTTMKEFSDCIEDLDLQCGVWEYNKSYFKFENWRLSTKDFVDRIKGWWTSFEFIGKPDYILASKL